MIYINILLIALICVIVIDLSGFVDNIKQLIWKFAFKNNKPYKEYTLKPFDCSLCSTFWLSFIYILLIHQFSIHIMAYILVIAYFTTTLKDIILFIKDFFIKIIDELYKYFQIQ